MDMIITEHTATACPTGYKHKHAVCWSSIFAGTIAAIAATLVLFALGTGLGFASVNPWSNANPSAKVLTGAAFTWLILTQWGASALGGYITGRLRHKHAPTPRHILMFKDTVHGFLVWALATILVIGFSASFAMKGAMMDHHGRPGAEAASPMDPTAYYIDTLYRGANTHVRADQDVREETRRILAKNLRGKNTQFADNDRSYLAQLVTEYTGISPVAASERVDAVITQAKTDANDARKAASIVSLLTFLSFLLGAFIAAVAAALGGRHQDGLEYYANEGAMP